MTGDALDERAAAPVAVTVLSREVREAVEERSELEGNKEAEEGAEVEMWSEVVERRPRGSQPLIDCSRLAEALCVYGFKHKPRLLLCLIHTVMMENLVIFNPDNLNLYPPKDLHTHSEVQGPEFQAILLLILKSNSILSIICQIEYVKHTIFKQEN